MKVQLGVQLDLSMNFKKYFHVVGSSCLHSLWCIKLQVCMHVVQCNIHTLE